MKKQVWAKIFGIILLLGWVFVGLIGTEIIVGLAISWLLPADVLASPVVNATFSVIAYILGLILIVFVPSKVPKVRELVKSTRERLGLKGLPTWTDLGLAPIGYIAAIALAAGLTALFSLFPWFNSSEAQNLGYSIYMQGWERGIAFVELAVFAPMIEELIFRGWLYGNLRIRVPKIVAILLVSLLFGLVHMQWNVGVSVFAMSVVSCTLREITGTIYAGTLLHIINNVVAFYLVYVVGMG
ncbi:CPBP family intramembrane metalloprotease [Candidatus Saccharibacteria bacterium]|nr:CPBP family intramembrane metalloprotease [Candidatus Saccharibacteria bacterium]